MPAPAAAVNPPRGAAARRGWLALAAIAISGCLSVRGPAGKPAVTTFDIEGARAVSSADILSKLVTQPSGRFAWQEVEYFDEDAFETDLKRIVRYYQSRGYYAARVVDRQVRPDGEGRVALRVRVDEGAPTRVSRVRVEGLESAPGALDGLGELPVRPGSLFTEEAYDAAAESIRKALGRNGYFEGRVAQRAEVDAQKGEARITYSVTPGGRYRFGDVVVAGTVRVPEQRVRDQVGVEVVPGEVFDDGLLPKAQARVFDLGVFGGVRVTPGTPDPAQGTIPVVVAVHEAPFRTLRVGPGLLIEATKWNAGASATWADRNWLGGLRRLQLDARLGWAWVPNPVSPYKQGPVGLAGAHFTQPAALGSRIDFTAALEVEKGVEQAYDFTAERLRLGTPIHLGRAVALSPSYNLEVYQVQGDPTQEQFGAAQSFTVLRSCGGNRCVLSYLEQRMDLDLRDDPLETRQGLFATLSVQEGFRVAGYGFGFLKLLPEVRGFVPLGRRPVLALRARVGMVMPFGGQVTPIVAQLQSGGPNTMRGYYTSRLAPMVSLAGQPNTYAPVGGNGLVDGSAELRFPVAGSVWGVAFVDFGNVTLAASDALQLDQLQWAVGTGIRYHSPFGPLRLDVGIRVPRITAQGWQWAAVPVVTIDAQGRSHPIGLHNEPIAAVHFSLGEAF